MSKRLFRNIEVLLSFLTLFVLGVSFYFQYVLDMTPCPLCIMQRTMALILLLFCLMGVSLGTIKRAKIISIAQMISAMAGMYFAGRQLWLQSLPAESTPACVPGLDVLMKYFPWQDILHALLWGAGDCAEVNWSWLGLSIPAWSMLYFATIFLGALFVYTQLAIRSE